MINAVTSIAEAVFNRLGVHYKKLPCRDGEFYFCKLSNDLTFDLICEEDGTIRLWRFVGVTSLSKVGLRYEYRKPRYPYTVIGIEVTDEGDISLYAEQTIAHNASRREVKIKHMIEAYISIISDMHFVDTYI